MRLKPASWMFSWLCSCVVFVFVLARVAPVVVTTCDNQEVWNKKTGISGCYAEFWSCQNEKIFQSTTLSEIQFLFCGELMSTRRKMGVEAKPGALRRSPPDTEKQHDENGGKRFIFIHVVVVSSVFFIQGEVDMFSIVFSWLASWVRENQMVHALRATKATKPASTCDRSNHVEPYIGMKLCSVQPKGLSKRWGPPKFWLSSIFQLEDSTSKETEWQHSKHDLAV